MKNKKFVVGIIGNGFVGEAQAFAFSPTCDIKICDINPLKSTHSLDDMFDCDFIFVRPNTNVKKWRSRFKFH